MNDPKANTCSINRLSFPIAPFTWNAAEQLRRIRWCVIPADMTDADYDALLSSNSHPETQPKCVAEIIH